MSAPVNQTRGRFGLPALLSGLGLLAFIAVCIGGSLLLGSNLLKSNGYQAALSRARGDAEVVAALGTSIESGWFVTGSISTQMLSGDANLTISILGPKKSGTLYAADRRANRVWQYYTRAVQVDGGSGIIDLR